MVRGEAVITAPVRAIHDFMWELDNYKTIDKMLKDAKVLEDLGGGRRVVHASFSSPWPLTDRDFVWQNNNLLVDGVGYAGGSSVSHRLAPEREDHVRGEILTSGYVWRSIANDDKRCRMTYLIQVDPKGYIPAMLVNHVATRQATNVSRLRDHFDTITDSLKRSVGENTHVVA
eukprot:GILJ01015122.1.p1 GENE.GILJ01015122.1~~GILJ01015122.1.p1  ORF type:complete len:173 (+),score=22.75 GILJ01015122.1:354-872(+)